MCIGIRKMQNKHEHSSARIVSSRSSSNHSQQSPNSMYCKSKTKYIVRVRSATPTYRHSACQGVPYRVEPLEVMQRNKSLGPVDFPIIVKCFSQFGQSITYNPKENAYLRQPAAAESGKCAQFDDAPSVELDIKCGGHDDESSDMDLE